MIWGIKNGFRIVDEGCTPDNVEVSNYQSATNVDARDKVEKQIQQELQNGRYKLVPTKPAIVSALGAIKKDNGDVRLIHDGSRPSGQGVNDYVSHLDSFKYESVIEASKLVNPNEFMCKVDLKGAYRSVEIHQDDYKFTGLKWKFNKDSCSSYMVDCRLPFGSRLAPSIFHRLSQAVKRIFQRKFQAKMSVFLDDFLIVAPTNEECTVLMNALIGLLRDLGFDISWPKCVSPTQSLVYLGIQLDSTSMRMTIPADKVAKITREMDQFLTCVRASKKQLESLAGKLSFMAQVVAGGRVYLRRIFTVIAKLKQPHHKVKLGEGFRADLSWWRAGIVAFNGKDIFPTHVNVHVVRLDACKEGSGFVCDNDWGYVNWSVDCPEYFNLHINHKEVLSALFAVRRWGPLWRNSLVVMGTDSQTAKAVLKRGTSSHPLVTQALREICFWSIVFNFSLDPFYIQGRLNDIPDAVSRLNTFNGLLRTQVLFQTNFIQFQPLCAHMSDSAYTVCFQKWSKAWMTSYRSTGVMPSRRVPNPRIGPSNGHMFSSA